MKTVEELGWKLREIYWDKECGDAGGIAVARYIKTLIRIEVIKEREKELKSLLYFIEKGMPLDELETLVKGVIYDCQDKLNQLQSEMKEG